MSDLSVQLVNTPDQTKVPVKYVDLGDGTFALAVAQAAQAATIPSVSELIALDAYTAEEASGDQAASSKTRLKVSLNLTVVDGTAFDVVIEFYDAITDTWERWNDALNGINYDAISAVGTYVFLVGGNLEEESLDPWADGLGHIYQATPNPAPPQPWRVRVVPDGSNANTYQVSGVAF